MNLKYAKKKYNICQSINQIRNFIHSPSQNIKRNNITSCIIQTNKYIKVNNIVRIKNDPTNKLS